MQTQRNWQKAAALYAPCGLAVAMLAGCGLNNTAPVTGEATGQLRLRGGLHGGQQPVTGATIQLMAAGTSGYGGSALPLLTTAVTTDTSGGFTISGQYTCPTATTQVYLLATGGNPGLPAAQTNPDLAMMAGLGSCGNLSASTFVAINEVTTVATAYALAGYMTGETHLSSSGSSLALQGLANAFGTITKLVDVSTGRARSLTPAGNATVPQAAISTIANILSTCVNSAGSGASSGPNPCSALETVAVASGGAVPTNTIDVVLNMAHLPAQAVSAIYALRPAVAPFQPTLATAPSDWSMTLTYATKLPSNTTVGGLAIDGSGNVWATGSNLNAVRVIGNDGTELSGASGYAIPGATGPTSVAIDLNGNGWVGGGNGVLAGVSAQGTALSGATGYASGYSVVNGVAVGIDNTLWLSDYYNAAHLTMAGAAIPPTPAQTYSDAYGVAVDSGGNTWFTNYSYTNVSKLLSGATYPTNYAVGYQNPHALAIGQNDHVWVADANANPGAVSELDSSGNPIGGSPYSGGALYAPWSVAMDGANHAWFTLNNCRCVIAMGTGGTFVTPSTGLANTMVKYGVGIGVDGSGNVWAESYDGSIQELVGAATPVVTPLAYAAKNNLLAQRP